MTFIQNPSQYSLTFMFREPKPLDIATEKYAVVITTRDNEHQEPEETTCDLSFTAMSLLELPRDRPSGILHL